jgi:hypothetical protein
MTEAEMQESLFAEIDLRARQDPRYGFIFHPPNGGDRDIRVAARLKAQGVRRGVPDLIWMLPACGYYGLAMELKVGKNKATPEQSDWLRWLSDRNYFTCTVYDDPQEAIEILQRYLEGAHP